MIFGKGNLMTAHFLKQAACVLALTGSMASGALAASYALLVGVSNYPSLDQQLQLTGPANDVQLMRDILLQRGFSLDHMQILADGVPKAGEPSRQNILSALDRIASQAKSGDYIYLHFAGHGSQQPTHVSKMPPEPDGLDEIFLPRDVGKWSDTVGVVENALIDSEINQAITRIRERGAFVWAVFDSCHSGTMTRGAHGGEMRMRKVTPDALGIPRQAIQAAENNAPRTRGASDPHKTGSLGAAVEGKAGHGGFVAFYASQTVEQTPEAYLPRASQPQDRRMHGLFSFTLAEALANHGGVTYRQLGQQVLQRYATYGREAPTPLFEGTALDAPIFGVEAHKSVRQWPIKLERGRISIGAGSLQQFGDGALFALVPGPSARDDEIMGYLRADRVMPLTAQLKPVAHADKRAMVLEEIRATHYVRMVDPNWRLSLRVALPEAKGSDVAAEAEARKILQAMRIAKSGEEGGGVNIEWVEPGLEADIRLLIAENKLWLLPADGNWVKEGAGKSHSIDLLKNRAMLADKIAESFKTVAKATNLLRLASYLGSNTATGLEVSATIIRRANGARETLDIARIPEFSDGDRVEFVFRNKGRAMVDVTVLYMDSEYGITALYPSQGHSNRIEVGAEDRLEIELHADTTGLERLLLIAVEAEAKAMHSDFSFLAQKKLERTRGDTASDGMHNLFSAAGFGVRTRGAGASVPLQRVDVRTYSWSVEEGR